jgi:hypothetical protein
MRCFSQGGLHEDSTNPEFNDRNKT